ncbi:MAG: endonuclease V [Candidatus Bathyarchaeota archaeon]|nr:endonuclease V [Candidatus Bathyarchaeota archaeon]
MNTVSIKPKFSIEKAHKTQLQLSKQIVSEDRLPEKIRLVAGVDVAYVKGISIGAVAVLDYNSLKLVESQTALCKTRFPYIPTLLSFREIPPTVLSIKKLRLQPDIFLVDGHGFAHPYRCGFASHLGLVIGKPTIGVAKSWLFGEVENVKAEEDVAFLKHDDEVIGAVIAMKSGCKLVYVSVGHMISLETAIKIVKHCTRYNRILEPILEAHEMATTEKRKINIASATNK